MQEWLLNAVLSSSEDLPEDLLGYALGRGLKRSLLEEIRIGCWKPPLTEAPDSAFVEENGPHGGTWRAGLLTVPYWSPRGKLLGVEFRSWGQAAKSIHSYRIEDNSPAPTFIGLTPSALSRIWAGGDVWLVEGVFDMSIAHVIPAKDSVLACGTARLTSQQLNFLFRFLNPSAMVHVVFDEDSTGRRQAEGYFDPVSGKRVLGVADRLKKAGLRSRHVRYTGGKDPGEIWDKGGKPGLKKAFQL